MMMNIEKYSVLGKNMLSREFYFESLLSLGYEKGLIGDLDIEKIQMMCLKLLAEKIRKFTSGESSSVRVEVGEKIMKSNLYTISIYLKSFPHPEDALEVLKKTDMETLYRMGFKKLETKIKAAKHFYAIVLEGLLETENLTYNETIKGGIEGFFKIYDFRYTANEINITADYPVANPVLDMAGIEFIQKYLESIYFENIFCNFFSRDDIHHLLCGYAEDYKNMVFNIFEQVLSISIGCILAEKTPLKLELSNEDIKKIKSIFENKTKEDIHLLIKIATQNLLNFFNLNSESDNKFKKYIEKAISSISENVFASIKIDALERIFYKPKYPENEKKIYFSFGEKMDDGKYRKVLEEIFGCMYSFEKLEIIKKNIHSLADIEDIIFDADLSLKEIFAVLKLLNITEVSALIKKYSEIYKTDLNDFAGRERTMIDYLNKFFKALPKEKQMNIKKTVKLIN